jgi:hypothetical protein
MNHLGLDPAIESRWRAYRHRLNLSAPNGGSPLLHEAQTTLEALLAGLRQALAAETAGDFVRYRLITYFHAQEEDFKNPPLNRQPLIPAPLGRDSRSP